MLLIIVARVRRDDVQSPESSRSASPVDESDFQDAQARLGKLLNLDTLLPVEEALQDTKDAAVSTRPGEDEEDEQEFEFRLFSAPSKPKDPEPSKSGNAEQARGSEPSEDEKSKSGTQKLRIRLRSPSPGAGGSEGRFVKSFRGWQYYFSTPSLYGIKEQNDVHEKKESEQRDRFEDMAVTGEHVLSLLKSQPWVSLIAVVYYFEMQHSD